MGRIQPGISEPARNIPGPDADAVFAASQQDSSPVLAGHDWPVPIFHYRKSGESLIDRMPLPLNTAVMRRRYVRHGLPRAHG